jgi:ribosomal RNA-processing protein 36
MSKRQNVGEYEEASSGDSDSSDWSDDEVTESGRMDKESVGSSGDVRNVARPSHSGDADDSSDGDSASSDGDDMGEGDSDSESDSEENEDSEKQTNEEGSDDDSSGEDLPLHERIQKKEQRGLSLQKVRERKSRALEVASKRLTAFKRSNRSDDNEASSTRKKKKSKHAPTEVSSKRSDFFNRGAPKLNESGIGVEIGAHRYKPIDPRTSNLSGHLNEEHFEQNYAFLEEMRNKEIGQLKKQIAARKVTGKKGKRMRRHLNVTGGTVEEDQESLKTLTMERADLERRKIERAATQSVKRKIINDVAEGTRGAFFLKRKEKKRLVVEAKLDEIRKRGGYKAVEKAVAKRRSKNKSRDAGKFAR